jgi:hypothetical protein
VQVAVTRNMLKIVKAPKENHRRAAAQEHPEKYSKKRINWNDAHHSQLSWQLVLKWTALVDLSGSMDQVDPEHLKCSR